MASTRKIQTVYYLGRTVMKTNQACNANSAILRCVEHLQFNHYDATLAEIFDHESGVLHAVLRRPISGEKIDIVFKREVKETYHV